MKKEMNKRRFLPLLALPLLLLAGCSKDGIEDDSLNVPEQNGNITFEIGFAPQTRVSTGAGFDSEWEEDDEIGIFAVEHDEPLKESGNFIHNVKLIYSGGKWSGEAYWPNSSSDITALDFYAYYPYDDNDNSPETLNPKGIVFNVKADQSGTTEVNNAEKSNYNLSDLLTAKAVKTDGYSKEDKTVPLTFSHALAMVQVSVPSSGKGFGPGPDLTVTLRGVQPGAVVNLNSIGATAGNEITVPTTDNDPVNITMCRVEQSGNETSYTYRALVPAQAVAKGTSLFLFEHEKRMFLRDGTLTEDFSMSAGQAETFERTLPVTLLHTVKIPAGTFWMGSPADEPSRKNYETRHEVKLTQDFRMSKYEITNAQYAEFLKAENIGENGKYSDQTQTLIYDSSKKTMARVIGVCTGTPMVANGFPWRAMKIILLSM